MTRLLSTLLLLACGVWPLDPALAAPRAADLVRAELVAEPATIAPGETFTVGIRMSMQDRWHVYWRNPGDSGLAPEIRWTLPPGFTAGAIRWPAPERIPVSHLVNYGYEGEATLLVELTAPAGLAPGATVPLKADLTYLVCERECIPGEASLSSGVQVAATGQAPRPDGGLRYVFEAARKRLPLAAPWPARVEAAGEELLLKVAAPGLRREAIRSAYFFPVEETAVEHAAPQPLGVDADGLTLRLKRSALASGPAPTELAGILALEEDIGGAVTRQAFLFGPENGPATSVAAGPPAVAPLSLASLAGLMAFAFLGGVVLNLMPCVFPVLSIKILSLAHHSGRSAGFVRMSGLAYAAGVVASFIVLAGLLLAVRAGGAEVGWGFQLQSPAFVAALVFLLFGLGLSLSGAVEFGASLAGRAARLDRGQGLSGSFLTGILAAVVATPCTAPFMGAAVGYALTAPVPAALAVFVALGLGLAAPFLLLTAFPALVSRLPRPGRWMEVLKQALAFPVYATVAWLVFVLAQQVSGGGLFAVLLGLVLIAFAAWLLRSTSDGRAWAVHLGRAGAAAVLLLLAAIGWNLEAQAPAGPGGTLASRAPAAGSAPQPFSQARLDALRQEGRPVFVNMTAAWCITCLVNEKTSLSGAAVREAFDKRDVAYLKGDWTNQNPEITRLLAAHGRSGVPLYLLYPGRGEPAVLPQILTEAIVLDSLANLPETTTKRAALH